jgi:hypothetical protein
MEEAVSARTKRRRSLLVSITLENNGGGDDATANSLTSGDELIPSTKAQRTSVD